jgi:hypothetical protein
VQTRRCHDKGKGPNVYRRPRTSRSGTRIYTIHHASCAMSGSHGGVTATGLLLMHPHTRGPRVAHYHKTSELQRSMGIGERRESGLSTEYRKRHRKSTMCRIASPIIYFPIIYDITALFHHPFLRLYKSENLNQVSSFAPPLNPPLELVDKVTQSTQQVYAHHGSGNYESFVV